MTYLKNVNEKGLVSIWNISNFSFALGILKCHSQVRMLKKKKKKLVIHFHMVFGSKTFISLFHLRNFLVSPFISSLLIFSILYFCKSLQMCSFHRFFLCKSFNIQPGNFWTFSISSSTYICELAGQMRAFLYSILNRSPWLPLVFHSSKAYQSICLSFLQRD